MMKTMEDGWLKFLHECMQSVGLFSYANLHRVLCGHFSSWINMTFISVTIISLFFFSPLLCVFSRRKSSLIVHATVLISREASDHLTWGHLQYRLLFSWIQFYQMSQKFPVLIMLHPQLFPFEKKPKSQACSWTGGFFFIAYRVITWHWPCATITTGFDK